MLTEAPSHTEDPWSGNERLYSDVIGIPLRTIARQRITIIALLVVIVLQVIPPIVLSMQLSKKDVFAFGFDRVRDRDSHGVTRTESVTPLNVLAMGSANAQLREASASYYLPLFIENLFGVNDIDTSRRALTRFVRPFVAPNGPAVETIKKYITTNDPVKRSEQMRVEVTADPLPPPRSDGSYRVTYTARSYSLDRTLLSTNRYSAIVMLRWGPPSPVFEKTPDGTTSGGNPVGMYVWSITPEQALNRDATGVGP